MKFKFVYTGVVYEIPKRMRPSLVRYIEKGVPAGNFLTAVFENDLSNAVGYADKENMLNIPAYVHFLYNYAPSKCWGSKEKVKKWVSEHRKALSGAAQRV